MNCMFPEEDELDVNVLLFFSFFLDLSSLIL